MNNHQAFHLYKIFEDYSKEFLSFNYSPEYKLYKSYYLRKRDVENILEENSLFINALYEKDENTIKSITSKKEIEINEFLIGQNEKTNHENIERVTPLPLQARFVLIGWNYLRINIDEENRNNFILTLDKKAFNTSFFPQVTKMALAFDNKYFYNYCLDTLECTYQINQYYLFFKILAYYFRINKIDEYKNYCLDLMNSYKNKSAIDDAILNKVKDFIIKKAI
ncbi:MAG: hypothetical protein ACPKOI_03885 [Pleomorphochaeta sp.]